MDRIYHLLEVIYPWKDVAAARWTLEHTTGRARAGALEYLDNLLTGQMRKRVIPVLDDVPLEEKVRRGNVLLKSRVRDVEDSLAQLVHDPDQIIAATAIHFVESRAAWTLAGDLEYALEHRDVKDWYVFEAASWALAAQRMAADERRSRWMEPLPAVELADRLRRMPLFDYVAIDELFHISDAGRQVRHEHGRVLYQQGTSPDDLQFLLDGRVRSTVDADGHVSQTEIGPPAALAFEEVMEGAPAASTMTGCRSRRSALRYGVSRCWHCSPRTPTSCTASCGWPSSAKTARPGAASCAPPSAPSRVGRRPTRCSRLRRFC